MRSADARPGSDRTWWPRVPVGRSYWVGIKCVDAEIVRHLIDVGFRHAPAWTAWGYRGQRGGRGGSGEVGRVPYIKEKTLPAQR